MINPNRAYCIDCSVKMKWNPKKAEFTCPKCGKHINVAEFQIKRITLDRWIKNAPKHAR